MLLVYADAGSKTGEALLKIPKGGICAEAVTGTYRGTFAYAGYPRIPGHEFSAQIKDRNQGKMTEGKLKRGMIVTYEIHIFNWSEILPRTRAGKCCESKQ